MVKHSGSELVPESDPRGTATAIAMARWTKISTQMRRTVGLAYVPQMARRPAVMGRWSTPVSRVHPPSGLMPAMVKIQIAMAGWTRTLQRKKPPVAWVPVPRVGRPKYLHSLFI